MMKKYSGAAVAAVTLVSSTTVTGFVAPSPQRSSLITQSEKALSMSAFPDEENTYYPESNDTDESDTTVVPSQFGKKMSEAVPFLACSSVLQASELAGNVGFDPLGLSKSKEELWEYREAEIKHARLAMLAAIGWPTSELLDRDIATYFQLPSMLDDGDRAPTVLNGGLEHISPQFWGFCLGLCAAIDMYGVAKARRGGPDYFPGNLGFDPLNFFPSADKLQQERLKLAEIKHGRVAMVGVTGYGVEEYVTKMAVIDDTPMLFQPLSETVEEAVIGAMAAEEALGAAVVGAL